jgi:hypothetical protein
VASWARSGFLSEHLVRPGEDGDIVYRGFVDTSFLDLVSARAPIMAVAVSTHVLTSARHPLCIRSTA